MQVRVNWRVRGTVIAPRPATRAAITALVVDVRPEPNLARFTWNVPPAAQEVVAVRVYLWPSGSARPGTPTFEGPGTVVGARRYAEIGGLTEGVVYEWAAVAVRDATSPPTGTLVEGPEVTGRFIAEQAPDADGEPIRQRALSAIPRFGQTSEHVQRTFLAMANEVARLDAAVATVRTTAFPRLADAHLHLWESFFGLPMNPLDKTLQQRRSAVLAYFSKLTSGASGGAWVESLTFLLGTGWTYALHNPADPNSPPPYTLRITTAFPTQISAPLQPAATVVAQPGALAAGTYRYVVTSLNVFGETTPSLERSVTLTQASRVDLDWPDVGGAGSYKVYRAAGQGALATLAQTATSAYSDTGTATAAGAPPTTNTTRALNLGEAERLARQITPANLDLQIISGTGFIVGRSSLGDEPL